jgi:hypothetical protein
MLHVCQKEGWEVLENIYHYQMIEHDYGGGYIDLLTNVYVDFYNMNEA